jgi:hypothetical protein
VDPAIQANLSMHDLPDGEWSAAFICFVMHTAGVRRAHGFEFGQRHLAYTVGALRNRERGDRDRPFWLVDHVELEREVVPNGGDLLCFNRRVLVDGNWVVTNHSYASLRNQYWSGGNEHQPPRGSSHCAIVLETGRDAQGPFVETIGGNEAQSVRRQRLRIVPPGRILDAHGRPAFALIRMIGC